MMDDCTGCDIAEAHPCPWCGYGHVFTTHSYVTHCEGGDPVALFMDEDEWDKRYCDYPYKAAQ